MAQELKERGLPKIYDTVEIGLSRAELKQACAAWLRWKGSISDYRITDITLYPAEKYLVRFTVAPPLEKADKEKLVDEIVSEQQQA